jgi:hypothetical protein
MPNNYGIAPAGNPENPVNPVKKAISEIQRLCGQILAKDYADGADFVWASPPLATHTPNPRNPRYP